MVTSVERQFWVRYEGRLASDENGPIEAQGADAQHFVRALVGALRHRIDLRAEGVGLSGSAPHPTIRVYAVVKAEDDAGAIRVARAAFTAAILEVGSDDPGLPDETHRTWRADVVLQEACVRELIAAAA